MKIKQIEVRGGRTINTGNFNSVRVDFGLIADLEPGDDPDDCQRQLYREIRRKLDALEEQALATGR